MIFSVIYSVDCQRRDWLAKFLPRNYQRRSIWSITEKDEQYEYNYLGDDWKNGKHRKLCALLTKEQFERFLQECDLYADSVETMGSLGAPGLGLGFSPAISFNSPSEEAILNAYVTPIPEPVNWPTNKPFEERHWERLRRAVIDKYGKYR